jgi:hypothetical protein
VGFIKVAAAAEPAALRALLRFVLQFCGQLGLDKVDAGVNLARSQALQAMEELGFRAFHVGLGMQSPAAVAGGGGRATYNRPGALLLCDLR